MDNGPAPQNPGQINPAPQNQAPLKSAEEIELLFGQLPEKADEKTKSESVYVTELGNEYVNKIRDDRKGRIIYAELIFTVTVIWLFLILMIVVLCGQGKLKLSDTVLVTLITTTTIAVFGFFLAVVNYYFNKDRST
jgi:hypothetical protein